MFASKCRQTAEVYSRLGFASLITLACLVFVSRGRYSAAVHSLGFAALGFFTLFETLLYIAFATERWKKLPEKIRKHPWKILTAIAGVNAVVAAYLSGPVARDVIMNALHRPARYFPKTTALMTAFAGVGIWLFILALFALLPVVIVHFGNIVYRFVASHGARMGSLVWGLFGQDPTRLDRFGSEQERKGFTVVAHLAGSTTLVMLFLFLGSSELAFQKHLVKWTAYVEDCVPIAGYPALAEADHDPSARVVIDDNNPVSIAHIRGSDVVVDPIPSKP
jgi:hypothetical protein